MLLTFSFRYLSVRPLHLSYTRHLSSKEESTVRQLINGEAMDFFFVALTDYTVICRGVAPVFPLIRQLAENVLNVICIRFLFLPEWYLNFYDLNLQGFGNA